MDTVSTFLAMFSSFQSALTLPTYENLCVLVRGAILSSGPRTVTECIRCAWPWVTKHHSAYGNVLRRADIRGAKLMRILIQMILSLVPEGTVINLMVDETLVRRYGLYVSGVSMHRDPILSSQSRNEMRPGNKWVVLAIAVKLPFLENYVALPIMSALYISPKRAKHRRPGCEGKRHRTPSGLARLMVARFSKIVPRRKFRLIGDAAYATHEIADLLNPNSRWCPNGSMVSRFQMTARLHEEPGEYSGLGRPRIIGKRLPNPHQMASREDADWVRTPLQWYGGKLKEFMLLTGEGLWYRCSQGATWVRWVIVRKPEGKCKDEIFFTTDRNMSPVEIVECFVRRWSIEVTFEEARRHLGIETLRNRTANAIHRSVPMLLALYSLIIVWYSNNRDKIALCSNSAPWYRKTSPTFSDMLKAAKQDILNDPFIKQAALKSAEFLVPPFPLNIIYSLIKYKHKAA